MLKVPEGYFVEWHGIVDGHDQWQSVFPYGEADLSHLHSTIEEAVQYFKEVKPQAHVKVLPKPTQPPVLPHITAADLDK